MPCNGKDHSPSCECGWGGVWYGNIPHGGGGRFYCDGDPSIPRAESIHKLIEYRIALLSENLNKLAPKNATSMTRKNTARRPVVTGPQPNRSATKNARIVEA